MKIRIAIPHGQPLIGPLIEAVGVEPLDATPTSHLRLVGVGQGDRLAASPMNYLITRSAALELLGELQRILQVGDSR